MKIFCLANSLTPSVIGDAAPVVYLKADSSLRKGNKPFFVPDTMGRITAELNLVLRICRLGKGIPERFAHRYYDAVTVGLDFTAADLLAEVREKGLPWDTCKGFDGAAAIGQWLPKEQLPPIEALRIRLERNGQVVQEGICGDMPRSADEAISRISRHFTLKTGDILYMGSPAAPVTVSIGDHLEGFLDGRQTLVTNCR